VNPRISIPILKKQDFVVVGVERAVHMAIVQEKVAKIGNSTE